MVLNWTQPLTEYFQGCKGDPYIKLALPLSGADFLEIWEAQPPGTPRACPDHYMDCFTFFLLSAFKIPLHLLRLNNLNFVVFLKNLISAALNLDQIFSFRIPVSKLCSGDGGGGTANIVHIRG